ncbi:MAG: glutamine synthetase [Hyphomicrobiales bacterium]
MSNTRDANQQIIMICCSDIAGRIRGKGIPVGQLEQRLATGVGWTPTNLMITAHGPIADGPWGPFGDLFLRPDPVTRVDIDPDGSGRFDRFILADICQTDGSEWGCCPRHFLRRALAALQSEAGLTLKGAFEHEFHYDGVSEAPGSSYTLDAFRLQDNFGDLFLAALSSAGITPDTFMPEYGPCQYEATVAPAAGITIADQAVIFRETARATAHRLGARVSFTPLVTPEAVGNGVHVHFSLMDATTGAPRNHDAGRPDGVSAVAARFLAGVLDKLPAITALTAPSSISYLRLVPNRWSASYNNLSAQNREAALRICPVFETARADIAKQYHFEYRAADAAASPYMVLGAIVWAGLHGIRNASLPDPTAIATDPQAMTPEQRQEHGLTRLPQSLSAALDLLRADADVKDWMGAEFHDAYLRHKQFEISLMAELTADEQCARYHKIY